MRLGRVVGDWVRRRHPAVSVWSWHELSGGGIACLVGLGIVSIAALDPRDHAFPQGRPAVYVAGLVFFLAGVASLLPALTRGRDASLAQAVVTAGLLSAFAAVPALIALRGGALPLFASVVVVGGLALAVWDLVLRRWIPRKAIRLSLYAGLLLVAGVAARRDPGDRQAETPAFEPVVLALQRDSVAAGEAVRVTFDPPIAMPAGYRYWVCIVPRGAEVSSYGRWAYLEPGASAVDLTAPDRPGDYEVRLHPHPNAVIASRPLVVRALGTPQRRPEVEAR